jgi:nitrite reductase/ring-hydroxylating ferredoxin subunit
VEAPELVRVCSVAQLENGERFVAESGEHEILVLALGAEIFAIGNICSHEEVWLDDGDLHIETCEIECPMHEGRFNLRTGTATHEPAERPIPTYKVVVDGDDVYVEVPAA